MVGRRLGRGFFGIGFPDLQMFDYSALAMLDMR